MQPNYYAMWHDLKDAIQEMAGEDDEIYLSDLERTIEEIELDHWD